MILQKHAFTAGFVKLCLYKQRNGQLINAKHCPFHRFSDVFSENLCLIKNHYKFQNNMPYFKYESAPTIVTAILCGKHTIESPSLQISPVLTHI